MLKHWEHFAHEADMGVRGFGATIEQAFEQAAVALTAVVTDPEAVRETEAVTLRCEAPDDQLLFVDWLNALVYEMATRHMLFGRGYQRKEKLALKGRNRKVDNSNAVFDLRVFASLRVKRRRRAI